MVLLFLTNGCVNNTIKPGAEVERYKQQTGISESVPEQTKDEFIKNTFVPDETEQPETKELYILLM